MLKPFVAKFRLPVGAVFGGCRHLGDGVFVRRFGSWPAADPDYAMNSYVPTVLEVVVQDHEEGPNDYYLDIIPDPLDGQTNLRRMIATGRFRYKGQIVHSDYELAEILGMSKEEYIKRIKKAPQE